MAKIKVSKEYGWLRRVPKQAIIDFLTTEKSEAAVQAALRKVDKSASGSAKTELLRLDFTRAICVFQECTETTPQEAHDLYDQYRYRGMKTLHLFSSDGLRKLTDSDRNTINKVLADRTQALNADSGTKFVNLHLTDTEDIGVHGEIVECSYSYHGFVSYTSTDTEYPAVAADLRRGFLWINPSRSWLCICSKDETVAFLLHDAIRDCHGFASQRLPLTKTVQLKIENDDDLRRAGYLNPITGTRRRISNSKMANDYDAMDEIRKRDASDDRPLAGFNVALDDKTSFALGYNESGKIYLSTDLTVDQMRKWGITKIDHIVQTVNDLKLNDPAGLVSDKLHAFAGLSGKTRAAVVGIASTVIRCMKDKVRDLPLKTSMLELGVDLRNYAQLVHRVHCPVCDDIADVACRCGGKDFATTRDGVFCRACNKSLSGQVRCSEGHDVAVNNGADCLELIPKDRLHDAVREAVLEASGSAYDPVRQSFSIRNGRLYYTGGLVKTLYHFGEISYFAKMLQSVPSAKDGQIRKALPSFAERCSKMSNDNCAKCIANGIGKACYLRLFGLFDANYRPRPHQGHEFGDYSTHVDINGASQQTMVIAMKSSSAKGEVTRRDSVGQDIYSQVAGYLHDGTIDVVGICLPRKLEDGFKAMLVKDARDKGKKLVMVDDNDLVQITYSVMQNSKMKLSDI